MAVDRLLRTLARSHVRVSVPREHRAAQPSDKLYLEFKTLVSSLRSNNGLTPSQACDAANAYADYFRDVCNLQIEATCQAKTRVYTGDGCNRTAATDSYLLHMFARADTRIYWSTYDPADTTGYAQTYWQPLDGLVGSVHIVGAVAFATNMGARRIYLFAIKKDSTKEKLVWLQYDLDQGTWTDEPTELDLPKEGSSETTSFTAVVKQQDQESTSPHLLVRLPSGSIWIAQFDSAGEKLGSNGWSLLVGPHLGSGFSELLAMVEFASDEFYLLVRQVSDNSIQYRCFGARDDGLFQWLSYLEEGFTTKYWFKGTFLWPNSAALFVFWGNESTTNCKLLDAGSTSRADAPIDSLEKLEKWLNERIGLSLKALVVPNGTSFNGRLYDGSNLFFYFAAYGNGDQQDKRI